MPFTLSAPSKCYHYLASQFTEQVSYKYIPFSHPHGQIVTVV